MSFLTYDTADNIITNLEIIEKLLFPETDFYRDNYLNLSNRSSRSNHRLVWRSLRIRTKMSVKTRLPRSCHIHFRFGSKSLIVSQRLKENLVIPSCESRGNLLVLKLSLFLWILLPFPRKRWILEAGPSQYISNYMIVSVRQNISMT